MHNISRSLAHSRTHVHYPFSGSHYDHSLSALHSQEGRLFYCWLFPQIYRPCGHLCCHWSTFKTRGTTLISSCKSRLQIWVLCHHSSNVNWSHLYWITLGHLLSHELRLAQAQPKVDLNLAGAHFASCGGSSRGGRGVSFSNNSQSGRSSSKQRTYRGRGRGRGPSTNGSCPTCQIYGKLGHVALTCYQHFNNSYSSDSNMQALLATPQSLTDDN